MVDFVASEEHASLEHLLFRIVDQKVQNFRIPLLEILEIVLVAIERTDESRALLQTVFLAWNVVRYPLKGFTHKVEDSLGGFGYHALS